MAACAVTHNTCLYGCEERADNKCIVSVASERMAIQYEHCGWLRIHQLGTFLQQTVKYCEKATRDENLICIIGFACVRRTSLRNTLLVGQCWFGNTLIGKTLRNHNKGLKIIRVLCAFPPEPTN